MMSPAGVLAEALQSWPGVRLAVLFGSAARGEAAPSSDLDVGVLFDPGRETAGALEVALARAAGRHVDLVRLDAAPPLLRFEIARDGRVLLERAPHAWPDFRARAMTDWWDWAPTARLLNRAAVERLRASVPDGPR
jgi:predicted nucleotidyltransferase